MEEHREQQPHYVSNQVCPDAYLKDEINLLDLGRVLLRQWKVICAIIGLSILGAVAYILLVTPVYEAQAVVAPPESKYVEVLNIPDISQISNADLFAKFKGNLKSGHLRQQFVEDNPQFSSLRNNEPKIKEGTKNEAGFVFLSLQGHDPKLVADWVNSFILLVERKTIGDLVDGVEEKITNEKRAIQYQIQTGRDFASQRRLDRIALLDEQIAIARASKIFDRQLSGYSVAGGQRVGVPEDTLQRPMYMRGVKELTAEKEELEKRKNDEPFIVGFRDKQEALAQLDAALKQLLEAKAIAHAVTVDQWAIRPKNLVKPRRIRVLAVSVVLGGMIGVFAVLVVNFVQQQKLKTKD